MASDFESQPPQVPMSAVAARLEAASLLAGLPLDAAADVAHRLERFGEALDALRGQLSLFDEPGRHRAVLRIDTSEREP